MIIGLTGGIGSGKSTVAGIFSVLGIPVYEADRESKRIIDTDQELQKNLADLLGEDVVVNQKINRPLMAERIFSDQKLLKQTNALIHPAVAKDFQEWFHTHQHASYVIREAAILFESGSYKDCEYIIVVSAPKEMRIQRVIDRSGISREEVEARMMNQWPEEEKISRADYVIYNDLQQSVIKQVLAVHEDLINQTDSRG